MDSSSTQKTIGEIEIKLNQQSTLAYCSVRQRCFKKIEEVEVSDPYWAQNIGVLYVKINSKADYFEKYASEFADFYKQWTSNSQLSSINQQLIKHISITVLGLNCDFHSSADFSTSSNKIERIIDLVLEVGGTEYISGPAAAQYLQADDFNSHGLKLTFAKYPEYGPYKQQHGKFIENLSVLDAVFNLGMSQTGCSAVWSDWISPGTRLALYRKQLAWSGRRKVLHGWWIWQIISCNRSCE